MGWVTVWKCLSPSIASGRLSSSVRGKVELTSGPKPVQSWTPQCFLEPKGAELALHLSQCCSELLGSSRLFPSLLPACKELQVYPKDCSPCRVATHAVPINGLQEGPDIALEDWMRFRSWQANGALNKENTLVKVHRLKSLNTLLWLSALEAQPLLRSPQPPGEDLEHFVQGVPGSSFARDTAAGFLFWPCKATAGTSPGSEEPRSGIPKLIAAMGSLHFHSGPSESLHWNACQRHSPVRQKINHFFPAKGQIIPPLLCRWHRSHLGDKSNPFTMRKLSLRSNILVPGTLRWNTISNVFACADALLCRGWSKD